MWHPGFPDVESYFFMHISAEPFANAGLSSEWMDHNVITSGNCFPGTCFGSSEFNVYRRGLTHAQALGIYIMKNRKDFLYKSQEARYSITYPMGAFEWAKDIKATKEDIVFIVYGQTMIENGVNPYAVDGWKYDEEHNWFIKSFDVG